MDSYSLGREAFPLTVYRVTYPGAQASYSRESGFKSASNFTPRRVKGFQNAVEYHLNWQCRTASPFISTFSNFQHAQNWAKRWTENHKEACTIVELEIETDHNVTVFHVSTLAEKLGVTPSIDPSFYRSEYLCFHRIPPRCIVQVSVVLPPRTASSASTPTVVTLAPPVKIPRCEHHFPELCPTSCANYAFTREELGEEEDNTTKPESQASVSIDKPTSKPTETKIGNIILLHRGASKTSEWQITERLISDTGGGLERASSELCQSTDFSDNEHESELMKQQANSPFRAILEAKRAEWNTATNEMRDIFQTMIEDRAVVTRVHDELSALQALRSSEFAAVFIMGPAPSQAYRELNSTLVSYAKDRGRTVVLCFGFPTNNNPTEFGRLFKLFGKDWESGSYERETFVRSSRLGSNFLKGQKVSTPLQELQRRSSHSFPKAWSIKALHARGVTRDEAVYLNERFQDSTPDGVELEAPIAFTSVGKGWLGYIGDVLFNDISASKSTLLVAKAMLGLHAV
ncbi:hypothetical protein FRC17_004981 [Serendipita sp. 399]|nr:hypothetical protein FRC17_004981 [Serendipita sp. 399]